MERELDWKWIDKIEKLRYQLPNGVVTNDIDPNGLALTATVVTNPNYGTLTLNTDGSFSYVHDGSENRDDVFNIIIIVSL